MSTTWLEPEQQRIWRAFLRMNRELDVALSRQMQQDSALSMPDFEVLVMLTDEPSGRLRMSTLADQLQWERSRLSHHVTRMAKRGLVERSDCSEDARGAFAVVTDEGRRAIEQAAPGHVAAVRRHVVDALSPEELAQLGAITEKVLVALGAPVAPVVEH